MMAAEVLLPVFGRLLSQNLRGEVGPGSAGAERLITGSQTTAFLLSSGCAGTPEEATAIAKALCSVGILTAVSSGSSGAESEFHEGQQYVINESPTPAAALRSKVDGASGARAGRDSLNVLSRALTRTSSMLRDRDGRGESIGSFSAGLSFSFAPNQSRDSVTDMLLTMFPGPHKEPRAGGTSSSRAPASYALPDGSGDRGHVQQHTPSTGMPVTYPSLRAAASPPAAAAETDAPAAAVAHPADTRRGAASAGAAADGHALQPAYQNHSQHHPASLSAALVAGLNHINAAMSLSVSIPATDTRTDATGQAFTVYGVRVTLAAGGADPWMVWRRYKEFHELHKQLTKRLAQVTDPGYREDGMPAVSAVDALLPELPSKGGVGNAVASVLGVGSGHLSRSFVEERRLKLEAYLRALVKVPAVWQCEQLVAFFDNDTRTLSTQVNYMRMIAAQRMLTYVTVGNAKRTRAMERKLSHTSNAVESLNRKMERLEQLLLDAQAKKQSMAEARPKTADAGRMDHGAIISDYFSNQVPGADAAAVTTARRGSAGQLQLQPLPPAPGTAEAAQAYVETYMRMRSMRLEIERDAQRAGKQRLQNGGPGSEPPAASPTPQLRDKTLLFASDMSAGELNALMDWVFGPLSSAFNATAPLDDSASPERVAAEEKITAAQVDEHRKSINDKSKRDAADAGIIASAGGGAGGGSGASVRDARYGKGGARGKGAKAAAAAAPPAPIEMAVRTAPAPLVDTSSGPFIRGGIPITIPPEYCLVPEFSATGPHAGDPLDAACPLFCDPFLADLVRRTDAVLSCLEPTPAAEHKRQSILSYVHSMISRSVGSEAFAMGSSTTKLYLPCGDIDVTTFVAAAQTGASSATQSASSGNEWFVRVNEALCKASMGGSGAAAAASAAAAAAASAQPTSATAAASGHASAERSAAHPPHSVRNVAFINADVRIVRCVVDNCEVDISANQASALAAAALVETVDRIIGKDHLFKRSVLLAKAWCELESSDFTTSGAPMLGSGSGGLSSYALTLLIMTLFNSHSRLIRHPLQALWLLFEEYADMPWGSHMVTIFGPRHLFVDLSATPHLQRPAAPRYITSSHLRPFRVYAATCNPRENLDFPFDIRNVNIMDPVAHWNNLGRSVSRKAVASLTEAFTLGRDRMRLLMRLAHQAARGVQPISSSIAVLDALFARVISWYGRGDGWREDMLQHPLDRGGAQERATRLAGMAAPAEPVPPPASRTQVDGAAVPVDPLAGDPASINYAISYSSLLNGCVSPAALAALTVQVLDSHGPMPVGELGKLLQETTGNASLPALVKEMFGGLKRFMESHPSLFELRADHAFNPTVALRPGAIAP